MIVGEPREINVAMVTRGGATIGADQAMKIEHVAHGKPQVQPSMKKKAPLDIQEQKSIFMDVCPDFVNTEQPSTSSQVKDMPKRFQKIFEQRSTNKTVNRVSKLKPPLVNLFSVNQE